MVWPSAAVASALVVLAAIVLEVVGASGANSQVPAWALYVFPVGWPQWIRVAWWLFVAGAAATFRLGLHRLGLRQRPLVAVVSVLPFLALAGGVAAGADWATWH